MQTDEQIAIALESIADSLNKMASVYIANQRYKEAMRDCDTERKMRELEREKDAMCIRCGYNQEKAENNG